MIKKIVAIIRPEKLDIVKDMLEEIECYGLTITEVKGRGEQLGLTEKYRGNSYHIDLINKIKIEIVTTEDKVDSIVKTIKDGAYTGNIGDGKIFISSVDSVIRIRTGEEGDGAI